MDSNLLNNRIGLLKDWQQKESINEILFNALSSLSSYTTDRFDALTQEIRDEAELNKEAPVIKIAVCAEDDIDKQMLLRPVSLEPPIKSPDYIATMFVECDYQSICELMRHTYPTEIKLKTGILRTQVALRYSTKYLQKLAALYYAFNENELPWTTVNGLYFYKFLDIYSEELEGQEVESYNIDFSEYERYISYDKVLLWNVFPITAPVALCEAKPAYDAIQYEHMLKNLPLDGQEYLICHIGDRFTSFRRGKMMYVRTYAKQLEQIELLRITSSENADSPLYLPIKSNRKKPGFINALARGRYIPTCGEAKRIIRMISEESDLRLVDMRIIPCTKENILRYQGIDFNAFTESSDFLPDRKLLLFTFDVRTRKLWAYETMFFVLSELQQHFYEYRCVGQMI